MNKKKLAAASLALILTITPTFTGCEQTFENLLIGVLTGFEKAPDPTIKEENFDFSVTYEVDGQVETLSGVFECSLKESGMNWDGWYISWTENIAANEWTDRLEENRFSILLKTTDDGAIYLDFNLHAEYLMCEPNSPVESMEPTVYIVYSESKAEELQTYVEYDAEVLEGYGVKLISYDYAAPIENTYN